MMQNAKKIFGMVIASASVALVGLTSSGAYLQWSTGSGGDMEKFSEAGKAIASNAFLALDLLPYIILVGAVLYILNKVFGIFHFGGGKKGAK